MTKIEFMLLNIFLILKLLKTTCCVKIYADTNKNLGDNINGKIQQLET